MRARERVQSPPAWVPAPTSCWSDHEILFAGLPLPQTRPVEIVDGVDHHRFLPLLLDRLTS